MTAAAIRRATAADVELLARHRVMLRAHGFEASAEAWRVLADASARAYVELMASGDYAAWIAERDGAVAGSVGMLLRRALPRLGGGAPYDARVQAMWVEPHLRRRGIGRALMQALLEHARALDVRRVELHSSADGLAFYPELGFTPSGELELWLTP